MKRAKKGFTLIEVICVLVIIAIVAVIAVPSISGYIKRSKINNCQHTMTNFVNDLEYEIVSRRYYDIEELNAELVKYVEANMDSVDKKSESKDNEDGTFESLTETVTSAVGSCPNGGSYKIEWVIKPGEEDNPNSARVHIAECICDCMEDDDDKVHVQTSYDFTAALIASSEYIKSQYSPEQIYEEEMLKIVDYIDKRLRNDSTPQSIDDIIKDYKKENPKSAYIVRGATVKSSISQTETNVEWLFVDLSTKYDDETDGHEFITYYPRSEKASSATELVNGLQSGKVTGKLVTTKVEGKDISDDSWPPVEGSKDSFFYLEGFNYSQDKNYQVADLKKKDYIQWVQRDQNWYVQKKGNTSGVNIGDSVPAEEKANYALINEHKLNKSAELEIVMLDTASETDFSKIFSVTAKYEDGSKATFEHLDSTSLDSDNYFIRNGYILVSSPEAVKDENGNVIPWTGIIANHVDENNNQIDSSQKENLQKLLDDEKEVEKSIFESVAAGKFENTDSTGEKYNTVTIAYQEYVKTYGSDGKYTYEPVTTFGTVKIYQKKDANGNVVPGADIKVKDIDGQDKIIATITVDDVKDSYNIKYTQSADSNEFSIDDLEITKKVAYTVEDTNPKAVNKVKSVFTNSVTLEPAKNDSQGNGYFIGADSEFSKSVTSKSIEAINNGSVITDENGIKKAEDFYIYLTDKDHTKIASISSKEIDESSLKWSYNKGEKDDYFSLDKISASAEYPIIIKAEEGDEVKKLGEIKVSSNGRIKIDFERRTSEDADGWFLTYDKDLDYLSPKEEENLVDKINNFVSTGVVKLYKAGDNYLSDNIDLFNVETTLSSVSQDHVVKKIDQSWLTKFLKRIDQMISNFTHVSLIGNSSVELYLDVTAKYLIDITSNNVTVADINFERELDLTDGSDRRFYVCGTKITDRAVNKSDEVSFKNNTFKASYKGDIYIYYTDGGVTKYTVFPFKLIHVPDFIYFHDESSNNIMHIVAYIGDDTDIVIPSTVEGYWNKVQIGGREGEDYEKVTLDGHDYYYIPKEEDNYKTYNVKYIGYDKGAYASWARAIAILGDRDYEGYANTEKSALRFPDNYDWSSLNSITVEEGVQTIGIYAFSKINKEKATNLKSISLPSSITKIGRNAFENLTLVGDGTFVIPEKVSTIETDAFKNFKIPNGTLYIKGGKGETNKLIENGIFEGTQFKKLVFGPAVKRIANSVFINKTTAESLDLGALELIGADTFYGWTNAKEDLIIPDSVKSIGSNAFYGWTNAKGDLYISEAVMTSIGDNAFYNYANSNKDKNNYPSLTIYGGLKSNNTDTASISGKYFKNGHFKNITIGGKVNTIDDNAFLNTKTDGKGVYDNLTGQLTIENSVKSIGVSAFKNCTGFNGSLILPYNDEFNKINESTFEECSGFTGDLDIPSNVKEIGTNAFKNCSGINGTLRLGNGVTLIGKEAFSGLRNVTGDLLIPDTVTRMYENAFKGFASGNKEPSEYPSLTILGGDNGTNLGSVIFTKGHFRNVTIGGNVKKIGMRAFDNSQPIETSFVVNNGVPEEIPIYPYDDFVGDLIIQDGVEIIDDESFFKCSGFTGSLDIPSSVTKIGKRAFAYCDGFSGNLKLKEGLSEIGTMAFYDCKKFTGGLEIPSTVTDGIGYFAFQSFASEVSNPYDIGKLSILAGSSDNGNKLVGAIFDGAKFNNVFIGGIVETIDNEAFHHKNVEIENNDQNYGKMVISKFDYSNITGDLVIGSSVTTIGDKAFMCDRGFDSVYIPESVISMGESAFDESGSGHGSLEINGCSRLEGTNNIHVLGDHVHSLFNKAKYTDVKIGGSVQVIDQYFMKTYTDNGFDFYYKDIKGDLTISGDVYEIRTEAFNEAGFDGELTFEGNNLTTIGYSAFENLKNMRGSLTIPPSVTSIDVRAFKKFASEGNKNYSEDKKPKLIIKGYSESNGDDKIIGYRIFSYARFDTVEIGGADSTVNTVGDYAFYNSNFDYTVGATGDATHEGNQHNFEGVSAEARDYKTIFDGSGIVDNSFQINNDTSNYVNFTKNVKILDGIKSIGIRAFGDNYGILNVDLSEASSLTTIKDDAFNRCTNAGGGLVIPKTVSSIGRCAFKQFGQNTDNPGTLKIYGYSDSSKDGTIKYIGMPLEDMNSDSKPIFPSAKFKDVIIGGTAEEAEVNAISDKFMNSQRADDITYNYTNITGSLTIGESITEIGREAFLCCSGFNGQLVLNNGLVSIGENAFNACSGFNGDLIIPETVTSIGSYAFKHFGQADGSRDNENKGSLTVLGYSSMKEGLKTIDAHIFDHAHFTNVTIGGTGDYVQYIADDFMENYTTETFDNGQTYVPRYNGVRGNLTIGDSVQKIGKEAFWDCGNFDGVLTIGNNVTYIGESAFSGCRGLYTSDEIASADRKLVVPSSVNYMGRFAFKAVGGYLGTEINDKFPALYIYGTSSNDGSLGTGDDHKAIFANSRFKNVTIGGNVVSIGENFMNNSNHTTNGTWYYNSNDDQWQGQYSYISGNLEILSSVKSIGKNAFNSFQYTQDFKENNADVYYTGKDDQGRPINCRYYNDKRGKLILHEGLQSIGDKAFANTKMFGNVTPVEDRVLTIPSSVTSIGDGAFENFCSTFNNKPTVIISSNYYYSIGTIFRNADVKEFKFN